MVTVLVGIALAVVVMGAIVLGLPPLLSWLDAKNVDPMGWFGRYCDFWDRRFR